MSIVGRKGKLSLQIGVESNQDLVWQRYEDVLTADVFGAYRYLPLDVGLLPFLKHTRDEKRHTLERFLSERGMALSKFNYARILFWPLFLDGREPDVLILLGSDVDHIQFALLVEAKLYAEQHTIPDAMGVQRSQLAHYAIQHSKGAYGGAHEEIKLPEAWAIIYVTRAARIPGRELRKARSEILTALDGVGEDEIGLFWCSWRSAAREAQRLWGLYHEEVASKPWLRLLLDLREDLASRDLVPRQSFKGISAPEYKYVVPIYRDRVRDHSIPPLRVESIYHERRYVDATPAIELSTISSVYLQREYVRDTDTNVSILPTLPYVSEIEE